MPLGIFVTSIFIGERIDETMNYIHNNKLEVFG